MDYCCTCLSGEIPERIFLNREEFKLPFIDAAFTEMIRNGGIY